MAKFIINGGRPIGGTFHPRGNKNAVLPMLASCVLTDQPVMLRNVPLIQDVRVMLELLESIGVEVALDGHSVTLCAKSLKTTELAPDLCARVRTSILLAGPLTARHGGATIYPPGGDVIGRRRLDTHFYGMRSLGAEISTDQAYRFKAGPLNAWKMVFDEASVTATENIMMAATLAQGTSTIYNAACEPHVQDLARLLNEMGADISGMGTNNLTIRGVENLHGAEYTVQPDYIEVGSYIAASVVTGGQLTIPDAGDPLTLQVMQRTFSKLGVEWSRNGRTLVVPQQAERRLRPDEGSATPKIEDGIWPAFPSDLMSVSIVLATQTRGTALFFEKMFESRMYFVDHLMGMGANIIQCDPHRVVVIGPTQLRGGMLTSPDIRAGMAMLIAACCAEGESVIKNAQVIDRGYEAIEDRLAALGADIVRID
ncbi:UDP-N-acetylglucosamine 1-carboxyvinyltransferase [Pontiella sulfatireligans]|uniref:UDP-N-acetylglucosamine 1-carboxyvinyltransferase n=1 Tax=Pontiella sulfatireligans TaxID=2750658 RepID=A0A6C2UN07_9BACT|nr:UDP-N-acetylglucosamine 1-carboxyvinyltransferase [Pontiella sulfatireligans]VGO21548.1 UDP-N-acetylglucosamine 1-carboxyvinyltransferase [Pontiella sulfatireligans]